jgi:hypothetical protein
MNNIRLCTKKDIEDLKEFLNNKWQKNHILTKDDLLLDFQHKNNDVYNFVISRDRNNKINGVLGFIPTYQFDQTLLKDSCVWLAIWKVDEEISSPGLGISLIKWLEENFNPRFIGTVGQNFEANKLYNMLGFYTGEMNHYYFANCDLEEFKILKNIDKNSIPKIFQDALPVKNINFTEIDDKIFINSPKKTKSYVENRFLNHPSYHYLFFGVFIDKQLKVLIIARIVVANNVSCLRIVDMYGNFSELENYQFDLKKLIKKYNCEYVDCLNHGIPRNFFINWGFCLKDDKVIIPEYFEPFIRKNKKIYFAIKPHFNDFTIFKSDCDQDRPNILTGNLYDKK